MELCCAAVQLCAALITFLPIACPLQIPNPMHFLMEASLGC